MTRIRDIIQFAVGENASDIHIAIGVQPLIRVASQLLPILKEEVVTEKEISEILQELVVSKELFQNFLDTREMDFAYHFNDDLRLRGNAFIQQGKIGIALRILPKVRTLEELKLPTVLREFALMRQGFFLVVGPVGQGKSTTMAAMTDLINQEKSAHIITIEHPIEYIFERKKSLIEQREVGLDTDSFESALRSAFRQDVNVIMVGEMRDKETIATAVTAAETGHLVLSTLHTNNAAQTIDRIIDSFPAEQQDQIRVQLANSLTGIFSQRLIPSLKGGVVPAYELLINTKAVANLIREGRIHEINVLIETGSEQGMVDMNNSLLELVRRGDVAIDEARERSLNQKAFDSLLG